jgi:hypothetical protein
MAASVSVTDPAALPVEYRTEEPVLDVRGPVRYMGNVRAGTALAAGKPAQTWHIERCSDEGVSSGRLSWNID